jgi:hypothetical protein
MTSSKRKRESEENGNDAIKFPGSGYALFTQYMREKLKKENPNFQFADYNKKISELWKDDRTKEV